MLAILHNYANSLLCDKRVVIADSEVTVNLRHDLYFLHGIKCSWLRQYAHIDLFDYISLIEGELSRFIWILDRWLHVDAELLLSTAILFK